jgi:hypothetical protein
MPLLIRSTDETIRELNERLTRAKAKLKGARKSEEGSIRGEIYAFNESLRIAEAQKASEVDKDTQLKVAHVAMFMMTDRMEELGLHGAAVTPFIKRAEEKLGLEKPSGL